MRQFAQQLFGGRESIAPSVIPGVVIGTVSNNNDLRDKSGLNRIAILLPWLTEGQEVMARVATPMAGNGHGLYVLPEPGDEVLVAFERGLSGFPVVVGSMWNGVDKSPVTNADGKNNLRVFKSRSGHQLIFNDEPGKETYEIVDASGKNSIVIDTANHSIAITSEQNIKLSAPKGAVTIEAQQINLTATGDGTFKANGAMTVHAKGELTVHGAPVNIN